MSTKVLILGRTGMLGHMVERVLSPDGDLEISGTHISDPEDPFYFRAEGGIDTLEKLFHKTGSYDYVINCIGITADKIKAEDSDSVVLATLINSCFPHQLAGLADRFRSRVIHISTDGVFSGLDESYDEDAPHDCRDLYGKTKSIGEVLGHSNFLNIRCSIIGPSPIEKRGLLEWFCSQPEGSVISGYTNHIWSGITTLQFAELCRTIIRNNGFERLRDESAVFHFSPNRPVSKYELLKMFKEVLDRKVTIKPTASEGGQIKRILKSKYAGLKSLYDYDCPMVDAIHQMAKFA